MYSLYHNKLKTLLINEFKSINLCSDSNHHVVNSMIETSLRGIDSHGVNLFPHYHRAVKSGRINCNPNINIYSRSGSTATIDADRAFGHHSGSKAIEVAQELAEKTGIGIVSVFNSTHFGAAGYFALQASRNNYLSFSFTNADALVKVTNAKKPYFGTNPICFTAPMEEEEPFCLDMATSIVSWNKILNAKRNNTPINSNWAADKDGIECTNPGEAVMLEAIGTYKGFGLGMMVEILCSILIDGPSGPNILPMFSSPIEARRNISHFFMVINIDYFTDLLEFKKRLKDIADEIRRMSNKKTIYVPGDPEKIQFAKRIKNGIPMDKLKYDEFLLINKDFKSVVY